MNADTSSTPTTRHIALCYIRQSRTQKPDDLASAEVQRNNILRVCIENGWTTVWFADIDGHKSGQREENRPGWLALKARINDPEVIALVTNDLARLHRKMWHVAQTMSLLDQHGVRLVLTAPGRSVDTSTPEGRMLITLLAMHDEAYANDVSERVKDSIQQRKDRGVTVGLPPFGTKRNSNGYLIPSDEGAWWMPNGSWIGGITGDKPPVPEAVWRGYYDCAKRILTEYIDSPAGNELIARRLREEGWSFRDRNGIPALLDLDDVRRVVRNWLEYAGIVIGQRAKERRVNEIDIFKLNIDPERAVFDLNLLYRVGIMHQERGIYAPNRGHRQSNPVYSYASITYCAHCERRALEEDNPSLRTRVISKPTTYQHHAHKTCGCIQHSIRRTTLEDSLRRYIATLTLRSDKTYLLTAENLNWKNDEKKAFFKEAVYVAMCAQVLTRLKENWETTDDDERHSTVRQLCEAIIVDLDRQQVVEIRLREWARPLITINS